MPEIVPEEDFRPFTQLNNRHIDELARQVQGVEITHIPARYNPEWRHDQLDIADYVLRVKAALLREVFKGSWEFSPIYIGVVVTDDDMGSRSEISGAYLTRAESDEAAQRMTGSWGGAAVIETTFELLGKDIGYFAEGYGTQPNLVAVGMLTAENVTRVARGDDPISLPKHTPTRKTGIATWHGTLGGYRIGYEERVWQCLTSTLMDRKL